MFYTLTDQDMKMRNWFQLELNKWYNIIDTHDEGSFNQAWFWHYKSPLMAVLFGFDDIKNPRLFKCNVWGERSEDDGARYGFTEMILDSETTLPSISYHQKITFAILCAKEVCADTEWTRWANNWLDDVDRSEDAARDTYRAVEKWWCGDSDTDYNASSAAIHAARAAVFGTGHISDTLVAWVAKRTYLSRKTDLTQLAKQAMERT